MVKYPPPKRPSRGGVMEPAATNPWPATLTLIAASYEEGVSLTLTFNQPVDTSAFNGEAVIVQDGVYTYTDYLATGAITMLSPASFRVELQAFEGTAVEVVTLSAPDYTGLVAVSNGATWSGVTDLALPFP